MLAVGILGGPVIGAITEKTAQTAIEKNVSADAYKQVSKEGKYILGSYSAVDVDKVAKLATTDKDAADKITAARDGANQGALARIALFPAFMFVCYIALILYFKTKGGYKAVDIHGGSH